MFLFCKKVCVFLFLFFMPVSLSMQVMLNTWGNFSLGAGEQDNVTFSIDGKDLKTDYRNTWLQDQGLSQNISLSETLENFLSNPYAWRISISVDGANAGDRILVLIKGGKTEKSFKMPYTRTKDRSKIAITVPFFARSVDLCPIERITQNSKLSITFLSLSELKVDVSLKVELSTPWLDWKEDPNESRTKETEATLSLSSPVIKTSLFSPFVASNSESILITIESDPDSDCFCSLVSIQQPSCPYFDSVSTAFR